MKEKEVYMCKPFEIEKENIDALFMENKEKLRSHTSQH